MFDPELKKNELISNRQLINIFHCAWEGGIRYSSTTDTVVLVINNMKKGLPNIWDKNELFFAGRISRNGKGVLSGANKRLFEFLQMNKDIFLFEVNQPGLYEYMGKVSSAGEMRIAHTDTDEEYPVFPLKIDGTG